MVVFSAEMHWIGSSLGKVCVHLWDVLVVLDFFIDLMFIQWESLRKHSLFSVDCDVNNARNGMLEAHVLIFSQGSMPWTLLETHACGDHGHGQV